MNFSLKLATSCVAWVALAGCASQPFDGKYSFSEGWRKGTVLRIEQGASVERPQFWSCLRHEPAAATATRSYVVVEYHQASHHRKHLVAAPADVQLRPGDKVYVNAAECENAIVRRDSGGEARS